MSDLLPSPPIPQTLKSVRYTHEAIIDEIIMAPEISQNELAKRFGFSATWVSIVVNSNAFQERLAERKAELVDPKLTASINERLDAIARRSLEKIMDRLDSPTAQLKTMELVSIAKLGVGDKNTRPAGPQLQQNLYVVALPPAAPDAKTWLAGAHANPRGSSEIIENVARG